MNTSFKDLFERIKLIILKPAEAWKNFRPEGKQKVLQSYVYPLLALSALADFLGRLFTMDGTLSVNKTIQTLLTQTVTTIISIFGGIFLACIILEQVCNWILDYKLERASSLKLVGYGFTITFLNYIVVGLIPDFRLIFFLLQIYTIYILWEGIPLLVPITSKKEAFKGKDLRLSITLISFVIILLAPIAVRMAFAFLTQLMN